MDSEKIDGNLTFDDVVERLGSTQTLTHDVILIIFCIVGVFLDAAIILTIVNYKRMRTVPNMFLVNWVIADLFSLLVAPCGYQMISILENLSMSPIFKCILGNLGAVLHLTLVIFVIVVSLDWLFATYLPNASEQLRLYYKYLISIVWIFAILLAILMLSLCINGIKLPIVIFLLMISFGAIWITTIVFHCFRAVRKYCLKAPTDLDYSSSMLTLVTAFVLCWTLSFITFIVRGNYVGANTRFLVIIAECLVFGSSIVNFSLLYSLNKDFQACFLQIVKCSGPSYQDSHLNFDNPIIRNKFGGTKDPIKISIEDLDDMLTEKVLLY